MRRMNEYQRGVLAAGAIILLSVILNAPTVQIHQGTIYRSGALADTVASVIDWRTTLTYGFGTLGVTALLWIALRGIGNTKTAGSQSHFVATALRTESFELTDKQGQCRVRLQAQENGEVLLGLADENGALRTWFAVDANGRLVETLRE